MKKQEFGRYFHKIVRESVLKSVLCGLTIGFLAAFICIAVSWFTGFSAGIYVGIGIFAAITAAATPLFYKYKFQPTTKRIAQRIDELGLEERILTMAELENDDSFIAMKQREDAVKAMKSVNAEMLKIAVSVPLIVAAAVSGTLGAGMTVAAAVAPDGGKQLIDSMKVKQTYSLTYSVEGSGWVIDFTKKENAKLLETVSAREKQREIDKLNGKEPVEDEAIPSVFSDRVSAAVSAVEENDATIVLDGVNDGSVTYSFQVTEGDEFRVVLMALPQSGYVFIGWSDGVKTPYRTDTEVTANKTVVAEFEEVESVEDEGDGTGSSGGQGDGQGEGDEDGEPSDSDSSEGGDGANDGSNSEDSSDKAGDSENTGNDGTDEGGKTYSANQVIDGKTYYGDLFDQAYQEMVDRLNGDSTMSDEEKKAITEYFDFIRK